MFKKITEGIALYKKAIKDYLIKSSKIKNREKLSRQNLGLDYRGWIDWTPCDLKWKRKTLAELSGMAKALGLSVKEWKNIWQEISEQTKAY